MKIQCLLATIMLVGGAPAIAKKNVDAGTPAQVQKLIGCRAITDPAQRLACFDRESSGVEQAIAKKDLVVVDREQARATRRSLFGFSLPGFGGLFGDDGEESVKQIESTVASSVRNGDGGWTVRLADNTTWMQTDDTPLGLSPKPGQKVVVRRGSMGSYYLSVNRQPGFKVKRVG